MGVNAYIKSGFTGPAAGYFLLAGAVVSFGGYIFTAFADDSDIEILVKFSAFGVEAGAVAPAPKWALTLTDNFKDWNPNRRDGLRLQLDAFQNIFFAFVVSRVAGRPDTIRIFISGLRSESRFEITFTARYRTDLPRDVPDSDPRRAGHQRITKVRVDADKLTMELVEGVPILLSRVTRNPSELAPALDVQVVADASGSDGDQVVAFPKLERLACRVTLDVYGDGGSMFVPSNKAGEAQAVELLVSSLIGDEQRSKPAVVSSSQFHA